MTAGKVNHRLVIYTHDGVRLAIAPHVQSWEISRNLNDKGWFNVVASEDFDPHLLGVDRLIEFWRQPVGGDDRCLAVGFMRRWGWKEIDGIERITFEGPDQVELISRRIVGYQANTDETSKTGPADDVIKEVVRENFIDPTAGVDDYSRPRYYPAINFTCDPDEGAGFNLERAFAWRNVLTVAQALATASYSYGIPLFFDVVPNGPAQFTFRTWPDVRGIDRTIRTGVAPIIFSKEAGNLSDPSLSFDYTEELSYVFGGGQGEGPHREIDPENFVIAQLREGESIWNKREAFQDARECGKNRDCIAAIAYKRLQEHRAKAYFSGDLLDMPQSRFGIDWNFGDKVTARYKGFDFDGYVRSYTIKVDEDGMEQITARLDVVEYAYGSPR